RALLALLPLVLAQRAEAQTPHDFTIDATQSSLQWSVTTSAGPLSARSPSAPSASGLAELNLFATTPVQALEIRAGSGFALPTLRAWIPSPNPFAPSPFDLRLSGLAFDFESLELPVDGSGQFAAQTTLRASSGTANFTFFGGPRPTVPLSAQATQLPSIPATSGQISRQGDSFELRLPLDVQFTVVEPTTLASANLQFLGTLVATAPANDEIANRYCSAEGTAPGGCTLCPCGNDGVAGQPGGCLNAFGSRAVLEAQGSNSLSAADLTFELRGASPGSFALLLSGEARGPSNPSSPCFGSDAGFVTNFSDGLRCLTTSLRRYGFRSTDAQGAVGTVTPAWGSARGADLFALGGQAAGQTRHFQALYRTSATSGCGTGQNSSDALSVTAVP
ncbi:MAG: hypothetical protein AAF368_09155, partial [Planctomycetota bacterium]